MEIPIQVAVRVCPIGLDKIKPDIIDPDQSIKEDEETEPQNDSANNAVKEDGNDDVKDDRLKCCVQAIPLTTTAMPYLPGGTADMGVDNGGGLTTGIVQVGPYSFPVTHALNFTCTQSQVYHQTVLSLVNLFMEGFDASVVTYGQRGTGKTFTLYGHCMNNSAKGNEQSQGIVQRCLREIFAQMSNYPERTYVVNIAWIQMCDEVISDILGAGSVHCTTIAEAFHWLKIGMLALAGAKKPNSHSLFTITLEQHWVTKEGMIQHRLSTASFSDLCATDRLFMINPLEPPSSLPKDIGLQSLENVVSILTNPLLLYESNGNVPYNQTTLTTLLKDSFGGRAQTLLILCVSPFERDVSETLCNLQFAVKVQCVRNFVIMNTFSDDNTPITTEGIIPDGSCGVNDTLPHGGEPSIDLQFATSQWFKLVSNAEGLLSKLISSYTLMDSDKEQIEQWLFLKQECEDCLTSNEVIRSQKQLRPIQESDEPDDDCDYISEPEPNTDIESDLESHQDELVEKLESLMEEFTLKTDNLVKDKYDEFMNTHPKGVMESQERVAEESLLETESIQSQEGQSQEGRSTASGRRRSLQPGTTLSSAEMAILHRVASREQNFNTNHHKIDEFLEGSNKILSLRPQPHSAVEQIEKKLRKLDVDIDAKLRQITEIEGTMNLKQNIIIELVENSGTRSTAKQKFHKKRAKLEAEYEKTKKTLAKFVVQGRDRQECEKLKAVLGHLEQRLQDVTSIKHIAGDGGQKLKQLQQSVQESKKSIDDLQRKLRKELKIKEALEIEFKSLKEKENTLVPIGINDKLGSHHTDEEKGKHLKEVQARISHLDHVLKEKSENFEKFGDDEKRETLRHEIRNLRHTRDHLLDERCSLDRKLKKEKSLSQKEERKLMECDEAIEAIDAAIEFKNELICGHKSIDTSDRLKRDKGEQMLMARLNKMSLEEMRTMLYKYFTKVIDLRDSSRKLEMQVLQLERERDAWEWKERVLSNAVRQARLEGERNAVLLQRQHEVQKALILRHLVEETSNSSSSFSDHVYSRNYLRSANIALTNAINASSTTITSGNTTTNSTAYLDIDSMTNTKYCKSSLSHKLNDLEMCPTNSTNTLTKYKPLDKFKEKSRETKNKLFKFQMLTRYASGVSGMSQQPSTSTSTSTNDDSIAIMPSSSTNHYHNNWKRGKDKIANDMNAVALGIPQENLKKLAANSNNTKVTRQKNKIIIQDNSRKN